MLFDETVLTFAEAAARLPRLNGKKLETRRIGGRFVTSLEALDRFAEKLAELEPPDGRYDKVAAAQERRHLKRRSSRERQKAIEAAEKELNRPGI